MSVATPVPLDLGGGDRGEVGVERDGSFSWLWFSYLTPTKFPEKDDHVNVLLGPLPQLWRILKVRGPMLPEPWQSPLWLLLRRLSSGWLWGRVRKGTEEACGLRAMEGWRVEVLSSLETECCVNRNWYQKTGCRRLFHWWNGAERVWGAMKLRNGGVEA